MNSRRNRRESIAIVPRAALVLFALGLPILPLEVEAPADGGWVNVPLSWIGVLLFAAGATVSRRRHGVFYAVPIVGSLAILGQLLSLFAKPPRASVREVMPGVWLAPESLNPPLPVLIADVLVLAGASGAGVLALLGIGLAARRVGEPVLLWIAGGAAASLASCGLLLLTGAGEGNVLVLGSFAAAVTAMLVLCALAWRGGVS